MHEYILIADNLHYTTLGCEKRKWLDNAGSYVDSGRQTENAVKQLLRRFDISQELSNWVVGMAIDILH